MPNIFSDRWGQEALTYAKVHTCDFGEEQNLTPGDGFFTAALDTREGPVAFAAGRYEIHSRYVYLLYIYTGIAKMKLKPSVAVGYPNRAGYRQLMHLVRGVARDGSFVQAFGELAKELEMAIAVTYER